RAGARGERRRDAPGDRRSDRRAVAAAAGRRIAPVPSRAARSRGGVPEPHRASPEGLMRAILAMVGKDLRLLARDRMGFFFTFVFPLMIAIFFGAMFSGGSREPRGLSIAVVDEDQSAESRAFSGMLGSVPVLDVEVM